MLLNAALHSKYFQGSGKRMLSSYLLNSHQAGFCRGGTLKMKGHQFSSFTVHHDGIYLSIKKMMHSVLETWISELGFGGQLAFMSLELCVFFDPAIPFLRIVTEELLVYPDFSQNSQIQQDWLSYVMLTCWHYDKWGNMGYKIILFFTIQYHHGFFAVSKYSTSEHLILL